MDKRFPSTGKKDPFAYKPEYNEQASTTAAQKPPSQQTPFDFKPEYNQEVKKKVAGEDLQIGSSPTQSTSPLPVKSAIDFINTDIDNNDFFAETAKPTNQFIPETTSLRVNKEVADLAKQEVFKSPESLQLYNQQRINNLNARIKELERSKLNFGKYVSAGVGAPPQFSIEDKKGYNEAEKQIQGTQVYINQLKDNIGAVASDMVIGEYAKGKYSPTEAGRKIIDIADPDMSARLKRIEDGNLTVPGITKAQIERVGLQAAKNFVARNPDNPLSQQLKDQITDHELSFDERNIDLTKSLVREKIGAQLYKESVSGLFGYDPDKLKEIAENPATALTDAQKKVFYTEVLPSEKGKLLGTDIPGYGPATSFTRAIERSIIGTVKGIEKLTGVRDDADQERELLNQELEESRYRRVGESPTALAELSYLKTKEKTEKLTAPEQQKKVELQKYTDVRNKFSRITDGIFDLTGQVVEMALITKGLGRVGNALTASAETGGLLGGLHRATAGQLLSNETVGIFVNSFLNSYDNYGKQALALMPGEDQAANRDGYAKTMAAVEGLFEQVLRDTKVLKAFTKEAAPSIRDITSRLINTDITQQVAKEETQKALFKTLKSFGKEFGKSIGEESFEEAGVQFTQGVADSIFGGQPFDVLKTGQDALNTFLTTALYSPLIAGIAGMGAVRRQRVQDAYVKSTIANMGANPAPYLQIVEDLQIDGTITQQESNEKIKLIKSASQYLKEIPTKRPQSVDVNDAAGQKVSKDQFDFPEVSTYLLHRMNEGLLNEQIENTTDEVVKSQLNKQLKRSQEIRKGIFNGSIGVTPDMQEVTDDPEKAEELGIEDANIVAASELIGTPFPFEPIDNQSEQANAPRGTLVMEAQEDEPQILTEEKAQEAADFANELMAEGIIPDTYHNMITKKDATPFWEMVAQQAQNRDSNWQPLEGDENKSEQAAIDAFGETVVNYAKELFPSEVGAQPVIIKPESNEASKSEENRDQETGQASQEGDSGIGQEQSQEGDVLDQQGAEPAAEAPLTTEKTISEKGKELASRIRQLKSRRDIAPAQIFGIAVGIYDGAIETVAKAIEAGAALAEAISQGIQHIRDNGGQNVDEKGFRGHLEDVEAGRKPKVKVQVGEQEQQQSDQEDQSTDQESTSANTIADYKMTTTDKVGKFLSGDTWEDVFGDAPEGDQSYLVQGLSDMLQDGKNMIAIAQQKWGGDVMMYGKNLFGVIQNMSNDEQLTNKKAVLLATFLGELQEAKLRSPERFDAINQLEKSVFSYYQNYMNVRGKEIVAGRLLRLYRDKYIGDIFADRILEAQQAKEKKSILEAEQKKKVTDEMAANEKTVTEQEKKEEDKADTKKYNESKKKQDKKKKLKSAEAKKMAEQKLSDIKNRIGEEGQKGLIAKINDAINKLNCK